MKTEIKEGLKERLKNQDEYKKLVSNLIVQGLCRLLEMKVLIKVRRQDYELVQSLIPECQSRFNTFLKEKTGKDVNVSLEVLSTHFLEKFESELGGIMLYCHNGRIVLNNTVEE